MNRVTHHVLRSLLESAEAVTESSTHLGADGKSTKVNFERSLALLGIYLNVSISDG
ncbi:MAG TPA: hypothetical protein VIJ40_08610 [Acidimicrobiales bacterium]